MLEATPVHRNQARPQLHHWVDFHRAEFEKIHYFLVWAIKQKSYRSQFQRREESLHLYSNWHHHDKEEGESQRKLR